MLLTDCTPLPNGGYRVHLSGAAPGSMIRPNPDIILVLPEPGAALRAPSPLFVLEDHLIALALEDQIDNLHLSTLVDAALRPLDPDLIPWGIGLDADHAALRSRPLTVDEVPAAITAFHAAAKALFALLSPLPNAPLAPTNTASPLQAAE